MPKIKIQISLEDIKYGIRCEPEHCPAAIALRREFQPTPTHVEVLDDVFDIDKKYRYELPTNLREFVSDFDDAKPVGPIEFELDTEDCKRLDLQITYPEWSLKQDEVMIDEKDKSKSDSR